jgi:SH3-like domain-containing protein
LGDSVRVSANRTFIRSAPASDARVVGDVPKATSLLIVGGTDAWLRVELPNGQTGYVASNTTETLKRPLRRLTLTSSGNLLDAADSRAGVLKTLTTGSPVDILSVFAGFQLVRSADGYTGWLSRLAAP